MQEALAYTITGETFERKIYLMWGSGRNGKSTLIDLMKRMLGKFYTAISEQVFMAQTRRSSQATPELMSLQMARLAVFSESKQGDNLDANRLKMLTGNDDIPERQLYGKQITFRPQAKYVLLTNHLPEFNVDDEAMIDRISLIPFQNKFELTTENKRFCESLLENIDGLFTILARKCKGIYARGRIMHPPATVEHVFQEYTSELDTVQQFIDHAKIENGETERSCLYMSYKGYTEHEGKNPDDKSNFYKKILKRGYNMKRTNKGQRFFRNISLRN